MPLLDPYHLIGSSHLVAIHGRVGDVVYKTYGRKIIVTRVPCFDGYVPTAAQRTQRDRMREATAYAKRVYADPAAKVVYVAAAKQLHRQPFRLAISDYLKGRPRVADRPPIVATPLATASPTPRAAPRRSDTRKARSAVRTHTQPIGSVAAGVPACRSESPRKPKRAGTKDCPYTFGVAPLRPFGTNRSNATLAPHAGKRLGTRRPRRRSSPYTREQGVRRTSSPPVQGRASPPRRHMPAATACHRISGIDAEFP